MNFWCSDILFHFLMQEISLQGEFSFKMKRYYALQVCQWNSRATGAQLADFGLKTQAFPHLQNYFSNK